MKENKRLNDTSVSPENLITEHLNIWTNALKPKASSGRGRGKGSGNGKYELYGIKKLRELIWELAVRGLLVPQDPNDEPASELLQKINSEKDKLIIEGKLKKQKRVKPVSDKEKRFIIPKGWFWTRLIDVYDVRDGTHDTPKYVNEGYPLVTSKNLSSGELDFSDVKYISKKDHRKISERSKVDKNDILFAMIGSIGNPVVVKVDTEFSIKNVALFKNYGSITLEPEYLLIFLKNAENIFKENSSGAVQSFVSLGKIREFPLALPPLAEQRSIALKVGELMDICDQLEEQTEQNIEAHKQLVETLLNALTNTKDHQAFSQAWDRIAENFDVLFTTEDSIEQLKQTILQLAVMGKLVPQDPNDEPASELLKKIAAEKQNLIKEGKIKKQKTLPPITEEEKPFELPRGWAWERLLNFSIVGTGSTPPRDNISYYNPPTYYWVTSGETSNEYIYETREKVSKTAIEKTNVTLYPAGTLIVAMYGQGKTRGQVAELMIEAGTNQACAAIQAIESSKHHIAYIKLFFQKSYEELRSHAAGGAQPNLNVGKVSKTIIPLPPLKEQQRIVTKVNELIKLSDLLKEKLHVLNSLDVKLADGLASRVS